MVGGFLYRKDRGEGIPGSGRGEKGFSAGSGQGMGKGAGENKEEIS
jgi:hypothetical protein